MCVKPMKIKCENLQEMDKFQAKQKMIKKKNTPEYRS